MEKKQYFEFQRRPNAAIFVDGNYMLGLSRALNIKLDVEKFFDEISINVFRYRTYWYSALESSLDRNNNAYRFLDRLRYIPRTRVYVGRMTKRSQGHYESALRTDAGIAMSLSMVEVAKTGKVDYIFLIASDPEFVPAVRAAQRDGVLVKLLYPNDLDDRSLDVHPDLLKSVDERETLSSARLLEFEYINDYQDDFDEVEYEYDDDLEFDDDDLDDEDLDDDDSLEENDLEEEFE